MFSDYWLLWNTARKMCWNTFSSAMWCFPLEHQRRNRPRHHTFSTHPYFKWEWPCPDSARICSIYAWSYPKTARLPKPACHPNTIRETAEKVTVVTTKPLIIFVSSYLHQRGRHLPCSNVASAHNHTGGYLTLRWMFRIYTPTLALASMLFVDIRRSFLRSSYVFKAYESLLILHMALNISHGIPRCY